MIIGIIPARLGSTRLPGKMLFDIGGRPLLWHTWSRAARASRLDRLVIAAGDEAIAEAARGFGADVVEAFEDVPSGSDRVYAAYRKLILQGEGCGLKIDDSRALHRRQGLDGDDDVIVNIQGDEPQLEPDSIDAAVGALLSDPDAGVGTVVAPLFTENEYSDPAVVKVALDNDRRVLYFSRAPIPSGVTFEHSQPQPAVYRHIGLYAFRRYSLEVFVALPPAALELAERLEQLRLLAAGVKFTVAIVPKAGMEVNTPYDLEQVRTCFNNSPLNSIQSGG